MMSLSANEMVLFVSNDCHNADLFLKVIPSESFLLIVLIETSAIVSW